MKAKPWTSLHRLMVSLPIFIMLMGVLVSISNLTTVPWNIEPTGQSMATLTDDTDVTFANPTGEALPSKGTYQVSERYITLNMTSDGNLTQETGVRGKANKNGVQTIKVLIREPQGAAGKRPGVVFMHGAGYGTCDNSFGDVASDMASAGFVTAVLDKPVWNTTDVNRDYMASAKAYDQVIAYLRQLENVDNAKVGIYATSESTWISSYLLQDDPDVAFQILLSPMVFSPRQSLGFFVTQDFTLAGANDGYQSIVQRVFSADTDLFSLTNFDLDTLKPAAYAVPTFVAYGSKDVMTAQVDGVRAILHNAHQANNWDVTVRSYPVANHVLRLGDESEAGTPIADAYVNDLIDWAVGTTAGYTQTSERVAGAGLYQSIGLPGALKARRVGTIYGVIVHVAVVLLLIASTILGLVALGRKIALNAQWRRNRREGKAGWHAPACQARGIRFRPWFRRNVADAYPYHAGRDADFLCRTRPSDYGRGQTCLGWRAHGNARGDVLELAGDPSGVCAGGLGMVSRVHEAYRGGLASWPYPVAAQARGGS